MEKKMTQKEMFAQVVKALNGEETKVSTEEMVNFINGRIEVLSHKSGSRKPTKVQVENEAAKVKVAEALSANGEPMRVGDLIKVVDFSEFSFEPTSQKVSALLKQMVENDKTAVKIADKKSSLFTVA